jgi:hypothetical protein
MELFDAYGRPLQASHTTNPPHIRGGWQVASGEESSTSLFLSSAHGLRRSDERKKARVAYFLNPLLYAGVNVIVSYVVSDAFSYGDLDDKTAQLALDEFWPANDLGSLTERMFIEHLLDGETATVFDKQQTSQRDAPGLIGLADVDRGVEVESRITGGVTSIQVANEEGRLEPYQQGEFVWLAHDALYNDPRGWPVVMRAIDPCLAYVGLLNHRLRAWEIQGRLNAVYKALVDTSTSDGGLAQHKAKAEIYGKIPRNGAVVTLAMDSQTGRSEELTFPEVGKGAGDASNDARLIRLLAAAALDLPEHYLGEGGNVTRTTADSMGDPARRGFLRRQAFVRTWGNEVFRRELKRRFGPERRYIKRIVKVRDDGLTRVVSRKRVPAEQVEVPWVFPSLSTDDIIGLTKKVETAHRLGLASRQTLSGELGYDPSIEQERMQNEASAGASPGRQPPNRQEEEDGDVVE